MPQPQIVIAILQSPHVELHKPYTVLVAENIEFNSGISINSHLESKLSDSPVPRLDMKKAEVPPKGTIFYTNVHSHMYNGNIEIIGRAKLDVISAFSAIEEKFIMMGLPVNEGKMKYILSTSKYLMYVFHPISFSHHLCCVR